MTFAKETKLEEVVVHGEEVQASEKNEVSHTVIYVDGLKNRIETVSEVLSRQAGVRIQRFGGLESATSISIRGSQADEVLVLYDGIPLNSALGGGVDLSPFGLQGLEKIEVYRGYSPAGMGFFPSAGVVLLKSLNLSAKPHAEASVQYGSFNTVGSHALFSQKKNKFGFLVGTSFSKTDGDFTFLDDNGTPINKADDRRVKRENNESFTLHPLLKLAYDFDDKTHLEWVGHMIQKDSGIAGISSNQAQNTSLSHREWLFNLGLKRSHFFHPNLAFESATYLRATKDQFTDEDNEIGLGGAQDNDEDTLLFGEKFLWKWVWEKNHVFKPFALFQTEIYRPEDFLASPSTGPTSNRRQFSFGLSDEMDFWDHRLLINPSVWSENMFNRLSGEDPSLAVVGADNNEVQNKVSGSLRAQVQVFPSLDFVAGVARQFRFPSFTELFGDRGALIGNTSLKPQKNVSWDAGFEFSGEKGVLKNYSLVATYFDRHVTDLIQFLQSAGFARAANIGKSRIQGLETSLATTWGNHVGISGQYTFQDAKDRGTNNGKFLPGRPEHELNTNVEVYNNKGKVFVSSNWISSNYLDPLNTRVVDERFLINSGISVKPLKKWTLSFEAKNISNEQIVDVVGFPLPGRSFMGKIEFSQ